jgi:hypothetical protein
VFQGAEVTMRIWGTIGLGLALLACGADRPPPVQGGAGGSGGAPGPCDLRCAAMLRCGLTDAPDAAACGKACREDTALEATLEACATCVKTGGCEAMVRDCSTVCAVPVQVLAVIVRGAAEDDGKSLFVSLRDDVGAVVETEATELAAGAGAVVLTRSPGETGTVHAFVDRDGDGACGGADRTWRAAAPARWSSSTVELLDALPQAPEACASFPADVRSLTVTGTGFGAADGAEVTLVLTGEQGGTTRADVRQTQLASGGFTLRFARSLDPSLTWKLGWIVDVDGDARCRPGVDIGGTVVLPAITSNVEVAVGPADAGEVPCAAGGG